MSAERTPGSNDANEQLLVLTKKSPVILALEKAMLSILEDNNGLCMDDENDRQALATALTPVILIEVFGFVESGTVNPEDNEQQ